jgi:hypothetical protein
VIRAVTEEVRRRAGVLDAMAGAISVQLIVKLPAAPPETPGIRTPVIFSVQSAER